jgi:thiamine biosynthesis lipoprotein
VSDLSRQHDVTRQTAALMGTLVTIDIPAHAAGAAAEADRSAAMGRAFGWFREIERRCTRFDPASELMTLCSRVGVPVPVSPVLFEAVRFALAVAEDTNGAFDPTVGHQMETRGFNREHHSGQIVTTPLASGVPVSFRDVELDPAAQTITLHRRLTLDLGAVAKGLAVDLAAHELRPFEHFVIDAGGDLFLGGRSASGALWSVGIRHPRHENALIHSVRVSNSAVCTSGDYEKPGVAVDGGHHILDPRARASACALASVTVVAGSAMLADALATAAFVLGPVEGLELLNRHNVDGLLISPALECHATEGLNRDHDRGGVVAPAPAGGAAILPDA